MQSYADEIAWLKQKVAENSASMLYARLADRYLQIKEVDRAIEFAEKGVLLHPHYATARYVLAKCYFENSQFDEANKHLKEALAADPNFLGALDLQSELLKRLRESERVEQNYALMLDIDPFNDDVHQKLHDLHQADLEPENIVEPGFEPDDFLESGISHYSENVEHLDHEIDEVIPDAPLQDIENDEQLNFDAPDSESVIEEPFADMFPEPAFESAQPANDDNPFEDFNDDAFTDRPQKTETHSPEDVENDTDSEVDSDKAKIRDEVLDESIDDAFEIDRSKYKEEEYRFTELLDNIFSSSIDEEEQAESDIRDTIERIANEDAVDTGIADSRPESQPRELISDEFEPLLNSEKIPTHEEQIIESAKDDQDELYGYDLDLETGSDEENSLPDEFITPDEIKDKEPISAEENVVEPLEEEQPAIDPDPKIDFSDFISSLDINEEVEPANQDEKLTFDEGLPDFDLDLDDEVAPAIHATPAEEKLNDEWFGFSSDSEQSESGEDEDLSPPFETSADLPSGEKMPQDSSEEGRGKGKFYTPTLGEIYAAQGQYSKAIAVFETLIKSNPENEMYQQKLSYLRRKLEEQQRGF